MTREERGVRDQLRHWGEDLVDLSRRNRLLYFTHTKTASLEFAQNAAAVEARLDTRRGWRFHLPPAPPTDAGTPERPPLPADDELVVSLRPTRYKPQIERGLKTLKSTAQAEFLDAGIWILYLGLGRLSWVDVDDKPAQSPLLLVPITLSQEGGEEAWRLRRSDDGEPALNPALAVKLERDFGIALPTLDSLEEADVAHVMSAVSHAVARTRWTVEPVAVLRTFTFHKEVIYRDLHQNEAVIAVHPAVRLLAEGPSSEVAEQLDFAPEDEHLLDERHPPEDLACVVDADATQRQCLIAARANRSFVMDGPPGTGKSQTITNVIAQLLADGRTVLFVSEKAAALDVVHNRLKGLKLDPFVMALHSHNATRKAVAQELGQALTTKPTATSRVDSTKRARLRREREKLTAYAVAVNEVRRPLERSLHDVIGRIAELDGPPVLPVPDVDTSTLDPAATTELLEAAAQLGRSWGPIERGDSFIWRDLKPARGGAAREARHRRRLKDCTDALEALEVAVSNVADELRLPRPDGPVGVDELAELLGLLEQRVPIGAAWLTVPDATVIFDRVDALVEDMRFHSVTELDLATRWPNWRDIDPDLATNLAAVESQLQELMPGESPLDDWTSSALKELAKDLSSSAEVIEDAVPAAEVLQSAFGLSGPISMELAGRLAELGRLAGSPHPPEPSWLNPVVKAALDDARRVLADLLRTYRSRRDALQATFTEDVLDLDLRSLHARFTDVHTGWHKLGGAYRADKSTLAQATVSGKVTKNVLAQLDEAIEWQDLARRLAQAEHRHAPQLGSRYYPSRQDADLDEIERAVALADQVLALAGGDVAPADLARQLGMGGNPDPRLPQAIGELTGVVKRLRSGLFYQRLRAIAEQAECFDMLDAVSWCQKTAEGLRRLAANLDNVNLVLGSTLTLADARVVTAGRSQMHHLDEAVAHALSTLSRELGTIAERPTAELIERGRDWAARIRDHFGGAVRAKSAQVLLRSDLTAAQLRDPYSLFSKAADGLFGEFSADYSDELRQECESSFESAYSLLDTMTRTLGDITEWETYVAARAHLVEAGWRATIEAIETERVPANKVAPLVERTVLSRWVDQVVDSDNRLEPKRSVDRDDLLHAFRALDAELVADAAAGVINACTARRPRSLAGGAGTINQQAQLKRRHMPVRKLLDVAGEAAQMLKPCFMMSPLSVSQFLPPGLRFDVVIFDEASQVREADAICSIYRGEQLIVAGDPKQLPPTDFFSRVAGADGGLDDDDGLDGDVFDFDSVLDRCKGQGIPSLPLEWHYRSRHESLITFSNRSFYDGRLHTFPGATFEAPDLGVELFQVEGQYRRGGTRDNPIEAERVVDRIVEHRRRHPKLTLGVVTLSAAQKSTIEAAIERRSQSQPELRDLVTDDRLHGFFVKNLENVQGDERDLIILSIGYGPDEHGKLTMNFGPMNRENGWRRLNVAVTRARRRVEVVSSVTAGQISSEKPSIRHLARYLDYAERGAAALSLDIDVQGGDAESPFEEEVLRSVTRLGYTAVPQVGVAGYRVDIGVRHPTKPGSYALGIECDGATYHSSKVARDRDRLRQQVLAGLGWHIHRIWSTAWFSDRPGEEARLQAAIDGALRSPSPSDSSSPSTPSVVEVAVDEVDFDDYPEWAWEYEMPRVTTPARAGTEFTDPSARSRITQQIVEVVTGYGPIHRSIVLDLIRASWGVGRSGGRVRDAFHAAVGTVLARQDIEADGEFLQLLDADIYVRVPSGKDAVPRRVQHVPPAELELAIVQLLRDAGTSDAARLRVAWARLFGWRRVGPDIEVAFEDAVDRLIGEGVVEGPDPLRLV
jgi:very-short-patch-repair endonuclease